MHHLVNPTLRHRWVSTGATTHSIMTFSITTLSIMKFSITTLSIMKFSITTLSIMGLFATLSIMEQRYLTPMQENSCLKLPQMSN